MFRLSTILLFILFVFQGYTQISFQQAQEKYEVKKYSDAVNVLDKLILKNDKDTQSYFLRAKCSFELRQVQKAYNDFSKYIDLDPVNGLAYLYRGKIMEYSDRYFDAINDYNAAIKYGRDTVVTSGYFHRGSCYMSVNNKTQAYNDLHISFQRNDSDKYIRLNYGTILCELDSIALGIAIFKQLIKEDKNDYVACQNIGYFSMNKEQYDTALVYYNRALAINPKLGSTYNNRGYLKYKTGNNQDALKDINTSLKLDKNNSFAYKNRALISIAQGKIDDACNDLIKARSLGFAEKYGNEVNQLIQQHCTNR
jgi:tetratricopeptide (TPR) repeat protein